jgi:hypothetical protein
MVGKPNLPVDAEQRRDLRGMANPTAGLNALDQEREASMADEAASPARSWKAKIRSSN